MGQNWELRGTYVGNTVQPIQAEGKYKGMMAGAALIEIDNSYFNKKTNQHVQKLDVTSIDFFGDRAAELPTKFKRGDQVVVVFSLGSKPKPGKVWPKVNGIFINLSSDQSGNQSPAPPTGQRPGYPEQYPSNEEEPF